MPFKFLSNNRVSHSGSTSKDRHSFSSPETTGCLFIMWSLIKKDDDEKLRTALGSLARTSLEEVLNGELAEQAEKPTRRKAFYSFFLTKKQNLQKESGPLFQAVMLGSFRCVHVLRDLGANILQQEKHGWNVVHYLAVVSFYSYDYENKAVKIYKRLLETLSPPETEELLRMEDKNGLRPLELAAHCCCLMLTKAILNTPGVYLSKVERRGLIEKSWYNVTEYEGIRSKGKRRHKNPIYLLTFMDRKVLKCPKALHELRQGILHKWAQQKLRTNILFIFFWFLHRALFFVGFYFLLAVDVQMYLYIAYVFYLGEPNTTTANDNVTTANSTSENNTESNSTTCERFTSWYLDQNNPIGMWVIMIFYSYISTVITTSITIDILTFLVELFTRPNRWNKCLGKKKNSTINPVLYSVSQVLFMTTALIYISQSFIAATSTTMQHYTYDGLVEACLIISCYLSVWSILYFVQLLPSIGHFVNIVLRMQMILLNFIIIYLIMFFPYPHVFLILLRGRDHCAVEGFENIAEGFYSVFKIMLNMMDFGLHYESLGKCGHPFPR